MPLNLPLPDWVPWWGQLVILVVSILFGFAFLMMPFAVFGLKGRLDFLEAQLDDIHAELRMIATRLPDPDRPASREPVFEELSSRPARPREPSPTQMAVTTPAAEPRPHASVGPVSVPHPTRVARPIEEAPPPRFTNEPDPRFAAAARRSAPQEMRAVPVERSYGRDGQPPAPLSAYGTAPAASRGTDWDERDTDQPLHRSPRATTLRDPARGSVRDGGRDLGRDNGRDRSEPTLRWPPR